MRLFSVLDKDSRLLLGGVFLGTAMTTLYELFKADIPIWFPNLPKLGEGFVLVYAFLFAVGSFSLLIWLMGRFGKKKKNPVTQEEIQDKIDDLTDLLKQFKHQSSEQTLKKSK